jgi:NitT/TauT family transport system substrate-binding protein
VRFLRGDQVYPGQQLAVVLYAGSFVKSVPEVARKFMLAYVKAARDYNDALSDGRSSDRTARGTDRLDDQP